MEKIIVANWKANLSETSAREWLTVFGGDYQPIPGLRVVVAVPFLFLAQLRQQFSTLREVSWAAQDISSYPPGRYTGAIPAAWLAGLVDFVLVGHRERRRYFHETIQDVANKVSEALEEEIHPILCVDMENARQQSAAVDPGKRERLTVAYTPDDAEQLEIARGSKSLAGEVERIGSLFRGAPILYGGGVNERNVAELLQVPGLSGVMAAGGCLDPQAFLRLIGNAGAALGPR